MAGRRRFDGHPTFALPGPDGDELTLFEPRTVPIELVDRVHVVEAAGRLDLVAWNTLGEPTRWWRVADANPSRRPEDLAQPGVILDVPVKD
mgnify:CR=1 FL=1